jgi:hypothetical protein
MFWRKKIPTPLDTVIEMALKDLMTFGPGTQEYDIRLARLERLYRQKEWETPKPEALSPNTVANVGANLLGILMIIRHERVNVIATKALSFVIKTKVS